MQLNGTHYTYVHNLQGDIVAILDAANVKVVEYKYDAWGKPTDTWSLVHATDSTLTTEYAKLAALNPFRYRGYVYDPETGLYYLRSRYYDPVWGRFLNADQFLDAALIGTNVFAYCRNAPSRFADLDGTGPSSSAFHGAVQWAVIADIIAKHPSSLRPGREISVYNPKTKKRGRIDLFNPNTHEIWEVKKVTLSADRALAQLEGYLGSEYAGDDPLYIDVKFTAGGPIASGVTYLDDYEIHYWWQDYGLIMYDIYSKGDGTLVPIPNPARARERERNLANRPANAFAYAFDFADLAYALCVIVGLAAWVASGGMTQMPYFSYAY